MATHALVRCPARCSPRRDIRTRSSLGARVAAFALALVAVLLMLNGEVWLLQRTTETPDELTVATCALDAVDPDASLMTGCSQSTMNVDKGTL